MAFFALGVNLDNTSLAFIPALALTVVAQLWTVSARLNNLDYSWLFLLIWLVPGCWPFTQVMLLFFKEHDGHSKHGGHLERFA